MLRPLLTLTAIVLLSSASAQAATIRVVETSEGRIGTRSTITFTAAPGETNDVVAIHEEAGSWVVRDEGAPLSAGAGCTALDANSARCSPAPFSSDAALLSTGDRDDRVQVQTSSARVDAGDGDDVVTGDGSLNGEAGRDTLTGGSANDSLSGGPGPDVIRGGGGDDALVGGGPADHEDDVLDGGAGVDTIFYGGKAAVVANLAARVAGRGGERDRLTAIEGVYGGDGDDRLFGDAGANQLTGGRGRDELVGRDGDDGLRGGPGRDRLDGGAGDDDLTDGDIGDQLIGGPGADYLQISGRVDADGGAGDDSFGFTDPPARLRCGRGADTVNSPVLAGTRLDGCEHVTFDAFGQQMFAVKPQRANGALILPVTCRKLGAPDVSRCRGRIELILRRTGRQPLRLGQASFDVAARSRVDVAIRPTASRRRALRATAHPLLELRVRASGPSSSGRWRVRL